MATPVKISVTISRHADQSWAQLYRVPHDIEIRLPVATANDARTYRGDGNHEGVARDNARLTGKTIPEVYRLLPSQVVPLDPSWIRLWRQLNPELSTEVFCTLLDNHYAWTNNTGWPGRYNCLTGEDAGKQNPAFHAALVCGGATLKGREANGNLVIDSLLTSQFAPSPEWVLERPWLWYWGTEVNPKGVVTYITRGVGNGKRVPVRVPLLTRFPIYLSLAWLDKLPLGFIPSDARWLP